MVAMIALSKYEYYQNHKMEWVVVLFELYSHTH